MRPQNALFAILLAWMGMLLLACSSSPDEVTPNPTGPEPALTVEQRLQVLKEAATFVKTLGDLTSEAAQQGLVTWLETRPEFDEAGILEGNVWATIWSICLLRKTIGMLTNGATESPMRLSVIKITSKHSATWPTVAPSVRPTQDTKARLATGG